MDTLLGIAMPFRRCISERPDCSQSADASVPPIHSPRDASSVHEERVTNLRWRLSSDSWQAKRQAVPRSLEALAEDHLRDVPSPTEPKKQRSRGIIKHRRSGKHKAARKARGQDVSFDDRPGPEVPVLLAPRELKRVPPRRGSGVRPPQSPPPLRAAVVGCPRTEHRAHANLARLMANHRRMQSGCCGWGGCLAIFRAAPAKGRKDPVKL
uniref:Uncharacterized protein n=1 Tax=Pyrodinium bahamense TaxID=73915 RepID=A0A7S0FYP3_9DINO